MNLKKYIYKLVSTKMSIYISYPLTKNPTKLKYKYLYI